jgi:hypothetical protein
MNTTLLWMLIIPLIFSLTTVFLLPKLARGFDIRSSVFFAGGGLLISALIITAAFYMGKGIKTGDTEIWNGEVTGKDRIHDSYTRTYQCNCTSSTDSKGHRTESCQTCTEDHYTVEWLVRSNIGSFQIDKLDETSRRVYQSPDPHFYTQVRIGDPCVKKKSYTNYIKAVPDTLFRPVSSDLKTKYAASIPAYPLNVFNYYSLNRVIPVGVRIGDLQTWNAQLSEALKKIGPKHQANAVIVVTNIADPNYFYALQDAWVGAKKNDIVIVIGAPEFPKKAEWVRIMAMTDRELFKVQLRDEIADMETLTADAVIGSLVNHTNSTYKRKRMRDFAYLDGEIDPPDWVMISLAAFNVFAYLGFWFYIWYSDRGSRNYPYNRRRF